MADVLKGKGVAILAADMFERVELEEPRKALEDAGRRRRDRLDPRRRHQGLRPLRAGEQGSGRQDGRGSVARDYDSLLIPGGSATGKPMAVICHGPWVLVEAGVVRGKRITSWPTLETDIRNAGGDWVDQEVVVDGNIVTSRKPDDIPAFNREMLRIFSGERVPA
ncbi:MAG TPA: DJ-1/PfpI family protein [Gaiellaceae bacterium]|nr:DJ-1/PfpI family protein [Gaiellaceae bacterium]